MLTRVPLLLAASLALAGPAAGQKSGTFTPGKDTTYVTGPLDADGCVDHPAALNARLAEGVTPGTNANVLLWKALGPRPEGGAGMPAEYFRLMGVAPPPDDGSYFASLADHERRAGVTGLYDQAAAAAKAPWAADRYPHVAAWLKANEAPLAVVLEAANRPKYFNPLLPTVKDGKSNGLISCLLPSVQKSRELVLALTARAMLRAGSGDPAAAWQDLMACHRLARHVGRGGTLIEGLVAIAVDAVTCRADVGLLAAPNLDPKFLRACLADLRALPPVVDFPRTLDQGERFMTLDAVMNLHRHGPAGADGGLGANLLRGLGGAGIDWDPAFKLANRTYDRMVAAAKLPTRAERGKAFDELERDLAGLRRKPGDAPPRSAKEVGEQIGKVLMGLLAPAVRKVADAADRSRQTQANTQAAFALALHRREKGAYPATLAALAPDYLPAPPADLFSGKELVYKPGAGGVLLYSVGPNGVDDGGRGADAEPRGDDLDVRLAAPVK